jgi:anti-sigma regulatory factor (Ser/Thr protein kinase)
MSAHRKTITLHNDLAELARLAEFVDAFCGPLHATEKDSMAFHLSLEEAVTNVINHGYKDGQPHTFTVGLSVSTDDRVTATITDDAVAYDPLARPPVDTSAPIEEREIGGLGVHLVKKLMDTCHYERRDGKNILTLERVIRRAS